MIAAADALDMSRAMVTRYLAEMEEWAGARLLHRSTRRLSLTDAGDVRTYDVTNDGVILGVTYATVDKPQDVTLTMASTGLDHALPDANMFTPESLARSVVPDKFKVAPKG